MNEQVTQAMPATETPEPGVRHRGRRRTGRRLMLAVVPLGMLASGALVYQASNAAFTAQTTSNAAFTTGSVVLTNSASTAFSLSGVKPGDSGNTCIDVTYGGNLPANVKVYLKNYTSTKPGPVANGLGQYLRVSIQETNNNKDCAGGPTYGAATTNDLSSLSTSYTGWSNGLAAWGGAQASQNDKHAFKISWSLADCGGGTAFGATGCPADQAAFDAFQGATAGADIVWEAHSS
jgi:hypothetical protein